jgi:hypothetical protein
LDSRTTGMRSCTSATKIVRLGDEHRA